MEHQPIESETQVQTIEFTLNGAPFRAEVNDDLSLMEVLREQAGLISLKNGCAPQGSCGCCALIVNEKVLSSCVVSAKSIAGKSVLTLEGMSEYERAIFSRAFTLSAGLQCGFCIPGIVSRAKNLIDKNPFPSRDEIARSLNNH